MLTEHELIERGLFNKNAISGRFYLGLNNQKALEAAGKKSKERMTFMQAKLFGYKVKPGAKSVVIKYEANTHVIEKAADGTILEKNEHYIKFHRVFSMDDLVRIDSTSPDKNTGPSQ